jgi:glucuronoarabinoxylan endo-1,4-beta-xylanase
MMAGMNAYLWWYIVRFYGPILEDGNISKRGYVMSQYSRFVRPGYHRIACLPPITQRNVFVTAYIDGATSRIVIVALNTGTAPLAQMFTLDGGSSASFVPYTTSQSKNCQEGSRIAVINGSFVTTLEPSSITTFISE